MARDDIRSALNLPSNYQGQVRVHLKGKSSVVLREQLSYDISWTEIVKLLAVAKEQPNLEEVKIRPSAKKTGWTAAVVIREVY